MDFVQDNPLENLNLAFDIAEKYLDIPKMLDAEGRILLYVQEVVTRPKVLNRTILSNWVHVT